MSTSSSCGDCCSTQSTGKTGCDGCRSFGSGTTHCGGLHAMWWVLRVIAIIIIAVVIFLK